MSPELLAARAKSAIRDGFDTLTQIVQRVIPEDSDGRQAALDTLRQAYGYALSAAEAIKET